MSVEPVSITVTTEIETGEVQHQLARVEGAKALGLDPDEVICLDVGPVSISRQAVWSPPEEPVFSEPDPETGAVTIIKEHVQAKLVTPAEYSFSSTWAPKHVDPKRAVHTEPAIAWPDVKLSRGAKWHGHVPGPDGEPIEAMLISDGDKLVLLDGPEGQAVLAEIGGEKPVSSTVAGNSFG